MSRIGELLGIVFYVYAEDHAPPPIHALYGDDEMLLEIATSAVLAGSLPGSKRRDALAWLDQNRAHAKSAWDRMNP